MAASAPNSGTVTPVSEEGPATLLFRNHPRGTGNFDDSLLRSDSDSEQDGDPSGRSCSSLMQYTRPGSFILQPPHPSISSTNSGLATAAAAAEVDEGAIITTSSDTALSRAEATATSALLGGVADTTRRKKRLLKKKKSPDKRTTTVYGQFGRANVPKKRMSSSRKQHDTVFREQQTSSLTSSTASAMMPHPAGGASMEPPRGRSAVGAGHSSVSHYGIDIHPQILQDSSAAATLLVAAPRQAPASGASVERSKMSHATVVTPDLGRRRLARRSASMRQVLLSSSLPDATASALPKKYRLHQPAKDEHGDSRGGPGYGRFVDDEGDEDGARGPSSPSIQRRKETPRNDVGVVSHNEGRKHRLYSSYGSNRGPNSSSRHSKGFYQCIRPMLQNMYLLLFMLGFAISGVGFAMDAGIGALWWLRYHIIGQKWDLSFITSYVLWIAMSCICIAISVVATHIWAAHAAGSGIPELRTILSGTRIFPKYLSLLTGAVKAFGCTLVVASGLPIGREGPFVHISAVLGSVLRELRPFRKLDKQEVLSAACAIGVATCFGAPIGGVLFSIEVTSTFYLVRNLWTAFYGATVAAICTATLRSVVTKEFDISLFGTNFTKISPRPTELAIFCLLGAGAGLLGALFVWLHAYIVKFRRRYQAYVLGVNPYVVAVVVAFVWAAVTFPIGEFMRLRTHEALDDMFRRSLRYNESLGDYIAPHGGSSPSGSTERPNPNANDWYSHEGVIFNLSMFFVINFFFVALSITLAFPCGLFAPSFAAGAAYGRIWGEILIRYWPDGLLGLPTAVLLPGGYAVVGAAALAAGVTRTLSTVVIVFELTGQLSHLLPVLVAVVTARIVGNALNESIYDSILLMQNIRLLPPQPPHWVAKKRLKVAGDLMDRGLTFVTPKPTEREVRSLLHEFPNWHAFPLVDDASSMLLLGEVRRDVLKDYLNVMQKRRKKMATGLRTLRAEYLKNRFQSRSSAVASGGGAVLPSLQAQAATTSAVMASSGVTEISSGNFKMDNSMRASSDEIASLDTVSGKEEAAAVELSGTVDPGRRWIEMPDVNVQSDYFAAPSVRMRHDTTLMKEISLISEPFVSRISISPFTISNRTSLSRVYFLFWMLRPRHAYVLSFTKLIGRISEEDLIGVTEDWTDE